MEPSVEPAPEPPNPSPASLAMLRALRHRRFALLWGGQSLSRIGDFLYEVTLALWVLKKTGSFYYHCDWHASHYVKVMLDQIFGENQFQSEIIWRRTPAKGLAFTGFPNNHDSVFYYAAGDTFTFNRPYIRYDPDNLDEKTLGGNIPLLLLFGQGDIGAMFRVEETVARDGGRETGLRLAPRGEGAPEVRRVDIVVGTADLLIREVHIYARLGGANHLYLDRIVMNPSLPPDLFRFRKARGEAVVDG